MDLQTRDAADYGNGLLKDLGCGETLNDMADHPALAWRRSGLLQTTQFMLPMPLASHADGALMALQALLPDAVLPGSGALLMGERARLRNTIREGRQCAGGYGRLLEAADGRIALNLVRDDDWDLIPAWLEDYAQDWAGITDIVRLKTKVYLIERAVEIGLAVAEDDLPKRPEQWVSVQRYKKASPIKQPLIVDLSGLWAGPLASSLLMMGGAKVVKIESPTRPDGMRLGHEGFYALMNSGKDCAALNFRDEEDLKKLKSLIGRADVVIEASRPRALQQLGIVAEEFVSQKPGQIWARLTAYGRDQNRIGFGDDIGISAGLANIMEVAHGEPCFVGDAIADPVNGIHMALAIQAMLNQGGGAVIDLCMKDVLCYAMGELPDNLTQTAKDWQTISNKDTAPFYPLRKPLGEVKPLGADNAAWQC